MESGLEGRNNAQPRAAKTNDATVSMESGLEGRNNAAASSLSTRYRR